jgi:hypothetical protein
LLGCYAAAAPRSVTSTPPEDNLQNRINLDFFKNNIITTPPNGSAKSSYPNPNQLSNLFRMISKPIPKHMTYEQTFDMK